jgi:hypothetical protein
VAKADASFVKASLPVFDEALGYFKDDIASTTYMAGIAALDACKQVSITTNGQIATGTVGRMSFPTIGDESATYDLSLALQGIDITL